MCVFSFFFYLSINLSICIFVQLLGERDNLFVRSVLFLYVFFSYLHFLLIVFLLLFLLLLLLSPPSLFSPPPPTFIIRLGLPLFYHLLFLSFYISLMLILPFFSLLSFSLFLIFPFSLHISTLHPLHLPFSSSLYHFIIPSSPLSLPITCFVYFYPFLPSLLRS